MTTTVCLAAVNAMLTKKGSFCYRHDRVNYLAFDNNLTIRMERINDDVCRVYFADSQQVQQPVPANVVLTNAAGNVVAPFLDNFLVTWVNTYTLTANGQPHLILDNLKQQSISGPAGAASGVL